MLAAATRWLDLGRATGRRSVTAQEPMEGRGAMIAGGVFPRYPKCRLTLEMTTRDLLIEAMEATAKRSTASDGRGTAPAPAHGGRVPATATAEPGRGLETQTVRHW